MKENLFFILSPHSSLSERSSVKNFVHLMNVSNPFDIGRKFLTSCFFEDIFPCDSITL